MGRIVSSFMIILTALLFVLGFTRYASNGFEGTFLPAWTEVISWLDDFPPISEEISSAINILNKVMDSDVCVVDPSVAGVVIPAECYSGGWEQLGLFIEKVGAFFSIIMSILSTPFRILGWFFVNFYS